MQQDKDWIIAFESESKDGSPKMLGIVPGTVTCFLGEVDGVRTFLLDKVYQPLRSGMLLAASEHSRPAINYRVELSGVSLPALRFTHLIDPSPLALGSLGTEKQSGARLLGLDQELLTALWNCSQTRCFDCGSLLKKALTDTERVLNYLDPAVLNSKEGVLLLGVKLDLTLSVPLSAYLEMLGSERLLYQGKLLSKDMLGPLFTRKVSDLDTGKDTLVVLDSFSLPLDPEAKESASEALKQLLANYPSLALAAVYSKLNGSKPELIELQTETRCPKCGKLVLAPRFTLEQFAGNPRFEKLAGSKVKDLIDFLPEDLIAADLLEKLKLLISLDLGELKLFKPLERVTIEESILIKLYALLSSGLSDLVLVLDRALDILPLELQIKGFRLLVEAGSSSNLSTLIITNQATLLNLSEQNFELSAGVVRQSTRSRLPNNLSKEQSSRASDLVTFCGVKQPLAGVKFSFPLSSLVTLQAKDSRSLDAFLRQSLIPWIKGQECKIGGFDREVNFGQFLQLSVADSAPSPAETLLSVVGVEKKFARALFQLGVVKKIGITEQDLILSKSRFRCEGCAGVGENFAGFDGRLIKLSDSLRRGENEDLLFGTFVACHHCGGAGFAPELLSLRFRGEELAKILRSPISKALALFSGERELEIALSTLADIGLEGVPLGVRVYRLSQSQLLRAKLGFSLSRLSTPRALEARPCLLLEHLFSSLSPQDIQPVLRPLRSFVEAGGSLFCVDNNQELLNFSDFRISI